MGSCTHDIIRTKSFTNDGTIHFKTAVHPLAAPNTSTSTLKACVTTEKENRKFKYI